MRDAAGDRRARIFTPVGSPFLPEDSQGVGREKIMSTNCSWFKFVQSRASSDWLRPWLAVMLFSLALPALGQTTISTVSGWDGSSAAYSFGFPQGVAHDTYGQTFTVPAGNPWISDINFRVGYNFGQGFSFTGVLMAWDGTEATGAVLYQSNPVTVDSSTVGLAVYDFPITGVSLTPGNKYVFFLLAVPGNGGAATAQFAITGNNDSYTGGNFVFTDSGGAFGPNLLTPWLQPDTASVYGDAVFEATFSSLEPATAPTFSVTPGTYASTQSLTIGDTTPNPTIFYTTNGSAPQFTGTTPEPGTSLCGSTCTISVSSTETIEAQAIASGYSSSAVATAAYTITLPPPPPPTAATPAFTPPAGAYSSALPVTISDTTPNATIYYTTNGSTPTTSSSVYSAGSPITVSSTETIEAIATASGLSTSAVGIAVYSIAVPGDWTWVSGSSTEGIGGGQPGVYGILGTPAAGNVPGGRYDASSWTDSSGNLWLFGGLGYDAGGTFGWPNDLWEFNPATSLCT